MEETLDIICGVSPLAPGLRWGSIIDLGELYQQVIFPLLTYFLLDV